MYRVLVIGAVASTAQTLRKLKQHDFCVVGMLGHEPKDLAKVSGWTDLRSLSAELDVPYRSFVKINDDAHLTWAREQQPDIIFAVGFSQLLCQDWLTLPKLGCIGFHPTKLPKGRGRAPLAWITLDQSFGSASYFLMGEGADDGPIFSQAVFSVSETDDAAAVEQKILKNIDVALDNWLPELQSGIWNPIPQNESEASWLGIRKPEDGRIDWSMAASSIDRLIKASSKPHPGAYTYFNDSKVLIWKSELEESIPIKGVVGRVLLKDDKRGLLIQCGIGLVWLLEIETESRLLPAVGDKLGFAVEDEIYRIKMLLKNRNI